MFGSLKRFVLRHEIIVEHPIIKGQIWQHVDRSDNPFKRDKIAEVEIKDYKNGWVNYKMLGGSMFQDESCKEYSFRYMYQLKEM